MPIACEKFEDTQTGKGSNISLSQLARSIRESATLKLKETAARLRDK